MKAICLPRKNRSSFWAICSSRMTFFLNWEFWMILFRADAIFASSISELGKILFRNRSRRFQLVQRINHLHFFDPQHSIRWKISTIGDLCIESNFPHQKRLWIREFVELQFRHLLSLPVRPWKSSVIPPYCGTRCQRPWCKCHLLCEQSSSFQLQGLLLDFFARRQVEFFEDDPLGESNKRFPVLRIDSMYQAAIFCRG